MNISNQKQQILLLFALAAINVRIKAEIKDCDYVPPGSITSGFS